MGKVPSEALEALSEVSFSSKKQQAQAERDEQFLCITVHEARNLVAKDFDTASSDPFARVSLASCVRKTRVIYRNCHPLWEQKLLLPLDGLPEGQPLLIELFDKDFRAKEFLGQVLMTVGKALEIARDTVIGQAYWFGLSKRQSADVVTGELCLGFDIISDAVTYKTLMEQLELQQDSEYIAKTLSSKALCVCLKGMNGLRASGLLSRSSKPRNGGQSLSLLIKFGRRIIERPLPDVPAEGDSCRVSTTADGFELVVNEEVVFSLAAAVRATPLVARRKDELLDVKFYIKSGTTTVAKTQIPVWDIPFLTGSSTSCSSDVPDTLAAVATAFPAAAAAAAAASVGEVLAEVVARPQMTSAKSMSELSELREQQRDKAAETARSCDFSLPSTPRGMRSSAEFLLASLRGTSTSSGSVSPVPESPRSTACRGPELDLVQRSKSDAAGALTYKQLQFGADAGSSSSSRGGRFVEGSLCSVTAASRYQQCSGSLTKRKAQGLAEFNDSVRSAFKLRLVPREVSHVGWTKADEACSGLLVAGQQAKSYSRVMEGLVQLSAQLEVGLTLQLVDHGAVQGSTGADAASEAAETAGVEALLDDLEDEEEVPDASPIAAPEPFDLVLVDDTVSTGVNRLHSLLLGSNSALMAQHQAAEGLLDVVVGPWRSYTHDCLRSRQVSYTKKLNIPFAPKQCQVWEEHKLLVKTDGGFVAEIACTNNAPKGDCFVARIQLFGVLLKSGSSRIRISMKLDWHKNTLGKSLVQSGAEGDAKRGWAALMKRLTQHLTSNQPGRSLQTVSATPSDTAAFVTAEAAASAATQEWSLQRASLSLQLLLAAVLVALLLLVVVVHKGASSISHELRLLNQVLLESSTGCSSVQSAGTGHPQLLTALQHNVRDKVSGRSV